MEQQTEIEIVEDSVSEPEENGSVPTPEEEIKESFEEPVSSDFDRLEALKNHERTAAEYREFSELFPGVSLSELPDSVNDSIRAGVPLAAAYALYHRKKEAAMAAASAINEKNRERSFAVRKNDSSDSYFSPSEVREMSPSEVRANYSKIIDSMSHWH